MPRCHTKIYNYISKSPLKINTFHGYAFFTITESYVDIIKKWEIKVIDVIKKRGCKFEMYSI